MLFSSFIYKLLGDNIRYAQSLGVTLGQNVFIGSNVEWPSEPYLITIGNNVQITDGVRFHTHGGGGAIRRMYPDFDCFGKITVEDYAYIGAGSQILPGVVIGSSSIVGAGSIVTKSVPPGVVVAGNPARVVGTIEHFISKNQIFNLHSKGMSSVEKKRFLLALPEDAFIKK